MSGLIKLLLTSNPPRSPLLTAALTCSVFSTLSFLENRELKRQVCCYHSPTNFPLIHNPPLRTSSSSLFSFSVFKAVCGTSWSAKSTMWRKNKKIWSFGWRRREASQMQHWLLSSMCVSVFSERMETNSGEGRSFLLRVPTCCSWELLLLMLQVYFYRNIWNDFSLLTYLLMLHCCCCFVCCSLGFYLSRHCVATPASHHSFSSTYPSKACVVMFLSGKGHVSFSGSVVLARLKTESFQCCVVWWMTFIQYDWVEMWVCRWMLWSICVFVEHKAIMTPGIFV